MKFTSQEQSCCFAHYTYSFFHDVSVVAVAVLVGTLQSGNGDVHENVTEKYTRHPFKPVRDFAKSPCYLQEGNLGWN